MAVIKHTLTVAKKRLIGILLIFVGKDYREAQYRVEYLFIIQRSS